MIETVDRLISSFAAKQTVPLKLNKNKLQAKFLVSILLAGLLAGVFFGAVSGSQEQANAQPPYSVPDAFVSASGNGFGTGVSDSQGNYSITSYLDTGSYSVSASATGYVDVEVDNVPVIAGLETADVNIMLSVSGVITGKVTDAVTGAPLSSVYVSASNASGGNGGGTTLTASDGTYRLDTNLPTGTYNVTTSFSQGHMSQTVSMISVTAGATTSNVNLALAKSAVISGTIRDSVSSAFLSDISVEAIDASGNIVATAATNSSGQYSLNTDLGTGTYNVTVIFPINHVPKTITGVMATAGSQTTRDITLDPSGILSGRITSAADGQPIAGVSVTASSDNGFFGLDTTNSSGYYRILSGLGTGSYAVLASYNGGLNATSGVNIVQGQETANVNLQITIEPSGTITGKVTDSTGNPIAFASVTAQGLIGSRSTTTNNAGDYALSSDLQTGTYSVTATAQGFNLQVQTAITVTVGQVTSNVNFQLSAKPSGRISGIVQTQQLALPPSPAPSPTATATPTPTPTSLPTATPTPTPTLSPTESPSSSPSASPAPTPSPTPIATPSPTAQPTTNPTATASPTHTPSPTNTPTPTSTTSTPSPTSTLTPNPIITPSQTASASPSESTLPSSSPNITSNPSSQLTTIIVIAVVIAALAAEFLVIILKRK